MFSIVVTTHRRPAELRRALQSVFAAGGGVAEVIVVDDLGLAETREALRAFAHRPLRYEHRAGPPGPAASRNLGVALARGRYVLFLDDDDEFDRGYLDMLAGELAARGYPRFGYTNWIKREWGAPGAARRCVATPRWIPENHAVQLLVSNCVALNAVFIDAAFARGFRFNEQLDTHEDWDWLIGVSRAQPAEHVDIFGPIVNVGAQPAGHRNTSGERGKGPAYLQIFARWPLTEAERALGLARYRVLALADLGISVGEDGV